MAAVASGTVYSSGYASGTLTRGTIDIYGTTSSTVILGNDGVEIINYGGKSYDTVVESGAIQQVNGGSAIRTMCRNGGRQIVEIDGKAIDTIIFNGGTMEIKSRGTASSTKLYGGMLISSRGIASSTTILGGTMTISSGGSAIATQIRGGGLQIIHSGATLIGNIVSDGGMTYSQGTSNLMISGRPVAGYSRDLEGSGNAIQSLCVYINQTSRVALAAGTSWNYFC
ncbi:MAG: AIDA repeat-containing protein [Victivallaceae bacterium]|nr:AIDA repeat-containing protein [Victivallaceae bacterium]